MDNKHRKLFVIKQSKGCKFMRKMHPKYVPPGPAGGANALPRPLAAIVGSILRGGKGVGGEGRKREGTYNL